MKRNDFKLLVEGWRDYLNINKENFGIISERGFYGGKGGYVTMTTRVPSDNILIYDDYQVLLGRPMSLGGDFNFTALTKELATQGDIEDFIMDILELCYGSSNLTNDDLDIVSERVEFYKKIFGADICTNDKTIFFMPFMHLSDSQLEAQRPYVKSDISGSNVDFDIENIDLSGKEYFTKDDYEHETKTKLTDKHKYLKLRHNINWGLHDLGHSLFQGFFDISHIDSVKIDFEKTNNIEYFKKLMEIDGKKIKFDGERIIDKFSERLFLYDIPELNEHTPGVGGGDVEYSFFSMLMNNPTEDGINNLINLIVDYVSSEEIFNKIDEETKKELKLKTERLRGFKTFKKILHNVFSIQVHIINKAYEKFKIIYIA